jgi:phage gp36-like protein
VWQCVLVFSTTASYATVGDMMASFPFRDLVQLSNEDPTQTTIDQGRLQTQLNLATSVINSYLETRYTLPLTHIPQLLRTLCLDIAMYRLQCLRPLHDLKDARMRYVDSQGILTQVNLGKLSLALDDTGVSVSSQELINTKVDPLVCRQPIFERRNMKGM